MPRRSQLCEDLRKCLRQRKSKCNYSELRRSSTVQSGVRQLLWLKSTKGESGRSWRVRAGSDLEGMVVHGGLTWSDILHLGYSMEKRLQRGRNGSRAYNSEAAITQRRKSRSWDLPGDSRRRGERTNLASGTNRMCIRLQTGSKDYTELGTEVGTKGKNVHIQDRWFTYRGSEGQSSLELYLCFSS